VAFTADLGADVTSSGSGGKLVCDRILSSVGEGSDSFGGEFTAQVSGTYFFILTVAPAANNDFALAFIMVGGSEKGCARAQGGSSSGMGHTVAHLKAGDKVWIKTAAGVETSFSGEWTTFSGFLLQADL
jgi:hypothetical protein